MTVIVSQSMNAKTCLDVKHAHKIIFTKDECQKTQCFNATKTKTMNISFKKESILDNYPVIFGNEVLNTVSHHRHLGIIIDEKLNWSAHIDTTLESVGKLCDVFIKLK